MLRDSQDLRTLANNEKNVEMMFRMERSDLKLRLLLPNRYVRREHMEYLRWIVKTGKVLVHRRFCYPRNINEIYIAELYKVFARNKWKI